MNDVIGAFEPPQETSGGETLMLRFSPSSVPLQQRWRNNGLSADFLADYVTTFLPMANGEVQAEQQRDQIRGAVGFVSNELLENAMKYSAGELAFPISIRLQLEKARVAFWETNTMSRSQADSFLAFVRRLVASDPNVLYVEQLEHGSEGGSTGLGFLTMVTDYEARLGWKFEDAPGGDAVTVTTQVVLAF